MHLLVVWIALLACPAWALSSRGGEDWLLSVTIQGEEVYSDRFSSEESCERFVTLSAVYGAIASERSFSATCTKPPPTLEVGEGQAYWDTDLRLEILPIFQRLLSLVLALAAGAWTTKVVAARSSLRIGAGRLRTSHLAATSAGGAVTAIGLLLCWWLGWLP